MQLGIDTNMSTKFNHLPERVNQQARDWFSLMQSGDTTDRDRQQLNEWLAESPEHSEAYEQLEVIWHGLGELATSPEAEALRRSVAETPITGKLKRVMNAPIHFAQGIASQIFKYKMSAAIAASVAVIAVLFLLPQAPDEAPAAHYLTRTGEIKSIVLADGSQLVLGAKSEIKARIADAERSVELLSGEAFFSVKKDPQRPFLVNINNVSVRVVGTQFDVRKRFDGVSVAVLEGIVNVVDAARDDGGVAARAPLVLTAGQRVVKPENSAFEAVETISDIELGAWRNGRLIYGGARLIDVISDANRYFEGSISLQAADLADLRVTLTVRADQVGQLPDMLAQTLPIVVRKMRGNQIEIASKVITD